MDKKKLFLFIGVIIVIAYAFFYTMSLYPGEETAYNERVQFLTTVVYEDGTYENFAIDTRQSTLGAALLEGGLIEGEEGDYGLYVTTVNGVKADESKEQWWCLTKDGEPVATGVDSTPIANEDVFEFTLKTGYDQSSTAE